MDRKTIRRYAARAACGPSNSPGVATGFSAGETGILPVQIPPPRPPAPGTEASPLGLRSAPGMDRGAGRSWAATRRASTRIWSSGTASRTAYNSVKRFVRALKAREPERFDVLESLPGEEAQVDFGAGRAHALRDRQVPPAVPVRDDTEVLGQDPSAKWCGKPTRTSGRDCTKRRSARSVAVSSYVVLDNLKQGVIRPDLYEPQLNPVYAAMLAHYAP